MKENLRDVTFLIAIRIDAIERLENLIMATRLLSRYFDTNIYVLEASSFNLEIIPRCLGRKVKYEFVEDEDPVFYRTKHFNQMVSSVKTPFIALWDADIVVEKKAVLESIELLRQNKYDVVYPYNTVFYDVPPVIRKVFIKNQRINILTRNTSKMEYLYTPPVVGGGVFLNREKFINAGMENEKHYGWGNDDWDRYYRFLQYDYRIFHTSNVLFHLAHPRTNNSKFRTALQGSMSKDELLLTKSSSPEETRKQINN